MPATTRSDLFIPEVLADAVAGAWPNRIALLGTDAVVESRTLPGGAKGGDKVRIPYFGVLGEFEIVGGGSPLTPSQAHHDHGGGRGAAGGEAF